ncbi:hypothetical protein Patl1_06156 [Pistacia atlantica]|uniref:Uncharacterized protein n=1 Tax=Pistacia atlantica TaxID=434234 RepID=A0ACC1BR45_9ROSI|nr:hypothetical protein Patl1_06156 [Pistacia atlantica]
MIRLNHWLAGLGVEAGSCHRDEDCKSECPNGGHCHDFRLCNCIQSTLKRPEFEISEYGTESDDDKKKYTPHCTGPRCARDPDCLDCPKR